MNKSALFLTALLAGWVLTNCQGVRTPVSADSQAATSRSTSSPERIGSGTISGSTVTDQPAPVVTIPLGGTDSTANRPNPPRGPAVGEMPGDTVPPSGTPPGSNPEVMPPAPPARNIDDDRRLKAAQQRAPEQAAPAAPPATPTNPTERERYTRDRSNPAGMEQRRAAQDMNAATELPAPESRIERLTRQLDALDQELENTRSARRRAALMKQRRSLMLALGKETTREVNP